MERYVVVPMGAMVGALTIKKFIFTARCSTYSRTSTAKRTGISYPLKFPTILYVVYTVCSIYSMWYIYVYVCDISFYKYKNSYNEG